MERKNAITSVVNTTWNHTYTLEELRQKVEEVRDYLVAFGFAPNACEKISISKKMSHTLGITTRQKRGGIFHYDIKFNYDYLSTASEENINNTIAHEVIHLCDGCFDHKEKFKYAASRLLIYGYKIERLSRDEAYSNLRKEKRAKKIQYKIYCSNCECYFGTFVNKTPKLKTLANPNQTRFYCPKCRNKKFKVLAYNPDGTSSQFVSINI